MDNKIGKQVEKILEQADVKELKRTKSFFRQIQSIELPVGGDRAWLATQFQVYLEALTLSKGQEEAARLWPFTLFTMGRAYERYYVQKKGYNERRG